VKDPGCTIVISGVEIRDPSSSKSTSISSSNVLPSTEITAVLEDVHFDVAIPAAA